MQWYGPKRNSDVILRYKVNNKNMKTRIVARALVYDKDRNMILLVRNKNCDFWYVPGGGWEYEQENILECAAREVKEETGLDVKIERFLYLREYHDSPEAIFFESFWLASVRDSAVLNKDHVDLDINGSVEEARWFTREDLAKLKVYPDIFKTAFWDDIGSIVVGNDRFIGAD